MTSRFKRLHGVPSDPKSCKELLAGIRPNHWRFLRPDNGNMPNGYAPLAPKEQTPDPLRVIPWGGP